MPHLEPPDYMVTVPCPKCNGTGGKSATWRMEKGQRIEIPAEDCSYCRGQKTVQARTEPRR